MLIIENPSTFYGVKVRLTGSISLLGESSAPAAPPPAPTPELPPKFGLDPL